MFFYFTRAAVGAGAPFGLAEDFARCACWLSCSGFDPALVCLPALQSLDSGRSSLKGYMIQNDREMQVRSSSALELSVIQVGSFAGDWLFDQKDPEKNLVLENVDIPFLVAAAAGVSGSTKCSIAWNSESCLMNVETNGSWDLFWNGEEFPELTGCSKVKVSKNLTDYSVSNFNHHRQCDFEQAKLHILESGITVGDSWPAVQNFFWRCLVPSNGESRRSGAGAGLIDID